MTKTTVAAESEETVLEADEARVKAHRIGGIVPGVVPVVANALLVPVMVVIHVNHWKHVGAVADGAIAHLTHKAGHRDVTAGFHDTRVKHFVDLGEKAPVGAVIAHRTTVARQGPGDDFEGSGAVLRIGYRGDSAAPTD